MANWCSTSYRIVGNPNDIKKIYDAIENPDHIEYSSKSWEGNVLSALGYDVNNRGGNLRGFIEDYVLYDEENAEGESMLSVYCEEAWSITSFSDKLCELFPDIAIYWSAEEPGCEVFMTNDWSGKYFPERYYVEVDTEDFQDSEYFEHEDEMWKWIKRNTGLKTSEEVDAFNRKSNDDGDCYFVNIYEFQVI